MIIVTGGAGFIGGNTVNYLTGIGKKVTVIDNLHTGRLDNIKQSGADFIKGDASAISGIKEKPEAVFHLGIYSSTGMYRNDRTLVQKAIGDFINVLEFARKHDARVVWASSSSVYNGNPLPFHEDMPILVTDFYTEARIAMERLATLYRNFYGVESIALRYFSVYGPGEESKGEYANLVSQFMWSLRRGEPPKIFGSGRQTRDFTYVEDVVRANIAAYGSKTKFGIYNIGTGVETQVIDMYHLLASKMKKDIAPSLVENPIKNYVDRTCAVTAKAERELGFKAKISLSEGIDRLLAMG